MSTLPVEGLSSPAATLSSVDFPQPVGPTIATNSPGKTRSSIPRTAVYVPPFTAKVIAKSRSATAVVSIVTLSRTRRMTRTLTLRFRHASGRNHDPGDPFVRDRNRETAHGQRQDKRRQLRTIQGPPRQEVARFGRLHEGQPGCRLPGQQQGPEHEEQPSVEL